MNSKSKENQDSIVFINPHTSHIAKIVSHEFNGKRNYHRYRYLVFSEYKKYRPIFYFNAANSSFRRFGVRKLLSFRFISLSEVVVWLIINRINPLRYRVRTGKKTLQKYHQVFLFSTDLIHYPESAIKELENFGGRVFINMTHYYLNPSKLSRIVNRLRNPVLVSEGALPSNNFYREFFKKSVPHIQIPWVVDPRFLGASEKYERISKCLVLGSLPRIENRDFKNYFGQENFLHPMRKSLYENQDLLIEQFTFFGKIAVNPGSAQEIRGRDHKFEFIYQKFDIQEELLRHSMFIAPEEVIGLPSVNFIDGMMMGCAYVGGDSEIYSGLGLISGTHYFSYDSRDLDALAVLIRRLQKEPELVKEVAKNGKRKAEEIFSELTIVSKLNEVFRA